jgi:hypothetical protein
MSAFAALRPMMQWFLAHTAMSGLVMWSFSSTEVEKWPLEVHLIAYGWICASAAVAIGLVFNGVVALMFEWWRGWRVQEKLPTAPAPLGDTAAVPAERGTGDAASPAAAGP